MMSVAAEIFLICTNVTKTNVAWANFNVFNRKKHVGKDIRPTCLLYMGALNPIGSYTLNLSHRILGFASYTLPHTLCFLLIAAQTMPLTYCIVQIASYKFHLTHCILHILS